MSIGVNPIKLNLKGRAGSDDSIKPQGSLKEKQQQCMVSMPIDVKQGKHSNACSSHAVMHIMICPTCSRHQIAKRSRLDINDLSKKIQCNSCNSTKPSKLWKCNCGVRWHICPRHSQNPPSKSDDTKIIVARKASKRLLSNASIGQILDDDLKRESKSAKKHFNEDNIELGFPVANRALKLGMIPQILRERFHLDTSMSSNI